MNAEQFLQEGYNDPSMTALKEWKNEQGTIGVYRSQYGYVYVFVLLDAEKRVYYQRQYNPIEPIEIPMRDAGVLATFAGAKEQS